MPLACIRHARLLENFGQDMFHCTNYYRLYLLCSAFDLKIGYNSILVVLEARTRVIFFF